jgi:hypothetical protein
VESQKKSVKAREFVRALRSGMDDDTVMAKYSLTRDQFHKLLRMALDTDLITNDELYSRISHSKTAITRAFVEMQEVVEELTEVTGVIDNKTE